MKQLARGIAVALLGVAGCAASSGVLRLGPDTYAVSASASPAEGGAVGALAMAYREAAQYCESLRREMFVVNNNTASGNALVTFRCVAPAELEAGAPARPRAEP